MELSRNITVIPARKRVGNTAAAEQRPKLKVAAYCRVSTDSEEQASSYEVQVAHYTQFIQKNPESELAGVYADDRKTGPCYNAIVHLCVWRTGRYGQILSKGERYL